MLRIALVLEVALVEHKHMTLIHPWLSQLHPRKKNMRNMVFANYQTWGFMPPINTRGHEKY
jgi:hypothetical protein